MMPSLRGFPVLMGLIFCPRAVVHTNQEGYRVSSVLCGLGYDPQTYKSRYPAHDIVFNLDFELTTDDMKIVNEIREYMNLTIDAVRCYMNKEPVMYSMEDCQSEILQRLKQLLRASREPLERIHTPGGLHWRRAATQLPVIIDTKDIWPRHSQVTLVEQSNIAEQDEINKHVEQMQDMALNMIPMTEITCKLCQIKLYEVHEMRIHLISRQHMENVKKLKNET